MKSFLLLAIALCALAGCSNISGKPLPMVSRDGPMWSLTSDHLRFGELPK